MNATTKFEKARLQATYSGDTHFPHEDDLQAILRALAGQDPETKALFALQTIVAKLKTSQSRKHWNYIMKNLVILDRAADERYFVKEISMLELPEVEEYQTKQRYKEKNIEDLVACYFRYIREKAGVYYQTKSPLNVAKEKRKQFFKGKDADNVLGEISSLKSLYTSAFEVFNTGANGHLKYKLSQYVFLLVLNSLMNILSTQYVAFISIVETFFEMDLHMASESLIAFKDFLKTTEDLITFTGNHQFIPGFQISLHELRNPIADAKLLNSMQEYIKILEEEEKGASAQPRPSIDAFDIPKKDLQPKISEINIAFFAGQFVAEKLDDEDVVEELNSSPPKSTAKSGEPFFPDSTRPSGSPTKTDGLVTSGKKNLPIAFENTFQIGYQGLVSIGENITEQQLDEYKLPEVEAPAEEQQDTETGEKPEEPVGVLAYRHLTPAFKKLLEHDQEDALFKTYDCYYSSNPESGVAKQTSIIQNGRLSRPNYEFKTLGIVLTECGNLEKGEDVGSMIDFEIDIFAKYKNLFSHEYRA